MALEFGDREIANENVSALTVALICQLQKQVMSRGPGIRGVPGHLSLCLSGYVEQHRRDYTEALEDAQKQPSYGRIVSFVCDAVIACHDEEAITKRVIAELPEVWARRGRFRAGSAAVRALGVLIRAPIMTARRLEAELRVSFQAASNALNVLSAKGVVRARTDHDRNRVFAAEEVISVLARSFGEDPKIGLETARACLGVTA